MCIMLVTGRFFPRDTMVLLEHLSHCKPVYHRYEKRKQAAQVCKQATESKLTCMRRTRKPSEDVCKQSGVKS